MDFVLGEGAGALILENMNMLLHVVLKYTKLEVAECQQMHIHNRSHPEGLG
jgi:hypothetical protein